MLMSSKLQVPFFPTSQLTTQKELKKGTGGQINYQIGLFSILCHFPIYRLWKQLITKWLKKNVKLEGLGSFDWTCEQPSFCFDSHRRNYI